jgi:hypothetical protein
MRTPNDYARNAPITNEARSNNVRQFLEYQLDKDDKAKLQRLRKNNYSRSDYYRLRRDNSIHKINGATLAQNYKRRAQPSRRRTRTEKSRLHLEGL